MNVSLDGYVDHEAFAPDAEQFGHWTDYVGGLAGSLYGRTLYDLMRYWDDDVPGWTPEERAFAVAWRRHPKWVVSRTLDSVGPNATLITGDVATEVRGLKDRLDGEIDAGGTILAQTLAEHGLVDAYRLYVHPVVLGGGTPFFAGPRPRLRLLSNEMFGEVVRLTYAPT